MKLTSEMQNEITNAFVASGSIARLSVMSMPPGTPCSALM